MDLTVCIGTYGDDSWREMAERAIASAEPQAKVIHEHAKSLAGARNAAGLRADTEWLCFLDADDELEPGFVEAMEAATADLRCPAVAYQAGGRRRPPKLWPEQDLREGNYLIIGTLLRRSMFLDVAGFKDWPLYEDWCLFQRCWKAGATIEQVPEAVYRAHVRTDSRNRAPARDERLRWHHAIREANFPELYEEAAA